MLYSRKNNLILLNPYVLIAININHGDAGTLIGSICKQHHTLLHLYAIRHEEYWQRTVQTQPGEDMLVVGDANPMSSPLSLSKVVTQIIELQIYLSS
jgi:hypothetical protein